MTNEGESIIRLLIADDHALLREGIRSIVSNSGNGIEVIGEVGTGAKAIDLCIALKPDILLLDISMPDITGIDVLKALAAQNIETRVIMLTMHTDPFHVRSCMKNSASGYVSKDSIGEELYDAIDTVMLGSVYLRPELVPALWGEPTEDNRSPHDIPILTAKENMVVRMIRAGYSSKMIAANLNVSTNTVRTHRANIMKKLDAHSAIELLKIIDGYASGPLENKP